MDMEAQVMEAMREELRRQAELGEVTTSEVENGLRVEGVVDLEALAMAVVGAVAGGP